METWLRNALFATSAVNVFGALLFVPASQPLRDLLGLPAGVAPVYLWILSLWILAFGLGYLWLAVRQRREPLFLAMGAFAKLSFFTVLAVGWLSGDVAPQAVAGAVWDLVIGTMFVVWLFKHRGLT